MLRVLRAFGIGALAGLAWGVVARGFMRLLAEEPAFTWSGTLAIVGVATVVGGLVMVVRTARLTGRSRWWRLLGLPFVLMFGGAGVTLVPGVVGVVMLADHRRWLRVPGAALVGLVVWFVVVQELEGSPTARQWAGVVVMLGCLVVLGLAARELVRRWRPEVVAAPAGGSGDLVRGPSARVPVPVDDDAGRRSSIAP
ncbi:MAG TPA: hypothetical protein VES93_06925 [Ornithinibacter sp.]|nr:hypothetical protein [Ornithinibacter sp.]